MLRPCSLFCPQISYLNFFLCRCCAQFIFDNKPASRWELNSHSHLQSGEGTPRVDGTPLSPLPAGASPEPFDVSHASAAKRKNKKKKALKRQVDEIPELPPSTAALAVAESADGDDVAAVSAPISI